MRPFIQNAVRPTTRRLAQQTFATTEPDAPATKHVPRLPPVHGYRPLLLSLHSQELCSLIATSLTCSVSITVQRLLTDPSPRLRAALRYTVYGKSGVFDVDRFIDIMEAFETFTDQAKTGVSFFSALY